jgi:hypothetical protein
VELYLHSPTSLHGECLTDQSSEVQISFGSGITMDCDLDGQGLIPGTGRRYFSIFSSVQTGCGILLGNEY